jgi:hypothetical protein
MQIYVLVDSVNSSASPQVGQPPTSIGAWGPLDIPDGDTPQQVASAFVRDQRFAMGSIVYVVPATALHKYETAVTLTDG